MGRLAGGCHPTWSKSGAGPSDKSVLLPCEAASTLTDLKVPIMKDIKMDNVLLDIFINV